MSIARVITKDISLYDFEAWDRGADSQQELIDRGLVTQFEDYVNEIYPEGIVDIDLNDMLRFDMDNFYEIYLGYVKDKDDNWVSPDSIEEEYEEEGW